MRIRKRIIGAAVVLLCGSVTCQAMWFDEDGTMLPYNRSWYFHQGLQMHFRIISENLQETKLISYTQECRTGHWTSQRIKVMDIPKTVDINGKEYTVTTIGADALKCLSDVYLPSSVLVVEDYNFHVISNNVVLNEGLRVIGNNCFEGYFPEKLTFPSTLQYIGSDCVYHSFMKEIVWPEALVSIGMHSFCDNENLLEARIPDSVEGIGKDSFCRNAALQTVVLPQNAIEIVNCFNDCPNITTIICHGDHFPSLIENCFDKVDKKNCTVIVPQGMKAKYLVDEEWSKFTNIVERASQNSVETLPEAEVTSENVYTLSGLRVPAENADGRSGILLRQKGRTVEKVLIR